MEEEYYEEEDNSFWDEPNPKYHNSGFHGSSGQTGSYQCSCGSWNTSQGTYFDHCNTCGEGQGY